MLLRWDAAQRLWKGIIKKLYEEAQKAGLDAPEGEVPQDLINIYESVLKDEDEDGQFRALILELPSKKEMASEILDVDRKLLDKAIEHFEKELGTRLENTFLAVWQKNMAKGNASFMHGSLTTSAPVGEKYEFIPSQVSKRAMRGICSSYLAAAKNTILANQLEDAFLKADNITDEGIMSNALINMGRKQEYVKLRDSKANS